MLDAAFSVIYIMVMAFYSWMLTIVALCLCCRSRWASPCWVLHYSAANSDQSAEENAKTQSHLVEVLTGIQTVKGSERGDGEPLEMAGVLREIIARTFEKP